MADQRIQATENMIGANHPTLTDTLNRLALVQHNTDGTHSGTYVCLPTGNGGGAFAVGALTATSVKSVAGGIVAQYSGTPGTSYQFDSTTFGYDAVNTVGWIQVGGTASANRHLALQSVGGNVLIGTATASTGAKLEVTGNISASTGFTAPINGDASGATINTSANSATFGLIVTGTAGSNRNLAIFGHAGFSNGVTIKSTGSAILLNVQNMPTSASGLSSGDIWRNGNVLNIV